MKQVVAGLFLFSLAALALAEGSYAMDVDVRPDGSGRANAFLCDLTVTDLDTNTPVMMPKLAFLSDANGPDILTTTTDDGRTFAFSISVDSKTSKAVAELKVTRAGKVIAEQKTSMAIRR